MRLKVKIGKKKITKELIVNHLDKKYNLLDLEAIEEVEDLMLCLNAQKRTERKKNPITYTWEEVKA